MSELLRATIALQEDSINMLESEVSRLTAECERLRGALKVCNQFVGEVSHAMQCGPSWYTHGEDGLRKQVYMWIGRAHKAIRDALGETNE